MPYKKAGSIVTDNRGLGSKSSSFQHHGSFAAVLMILGVVLRFAVPIVSPDSDPRRIDSGLWIASILAAIFWIWGCIHLAKHLGLPGAWGLWGFLFLIGLGIIFWASRQKPAWDRHKAMQPKKREYRGDPNSPY